MATLDELVVKIRADASGLESGMRRATAAVGSGAAGMQSSLGGVKSAFASLNSVVGALALGEFARRSFEAADRLNDLAARTGFAGSTLSALEVTLKQGGSNIDEFSAAVTRMNASIGEAAKGTNPEAIKSFDALGLSVSRLKGLSPEQQFYAITQALGRMADQGKLTEAGMNIFGRAFAAMIPAIRDNNGELEKYVANMKAAGDAVSDEQLKRIDEMGDRWTAAMHKLQMGVLMLLDLPTQAFNAGDAIGKAFINRGLGANVSRIRPATVNYATTGDDAKAKIDQALKRRGLPGLYGAGGGNADILKPKGGKGEAKREAEDYDKLNDALEEHLRKLEDERELAGLAGKALAERKAILEANAIAVKDGNLLSDGQKAKITAEVDATYDLTEATRKLDERQRQAKETAREWGNQLTDGLTGIVLRFDSATDSAKRFFDEIASQVLKKSVTGPISEGIMGMLGAGSESARPGGGMFSGIGKMLGFAAGGSPPVGVPSIVGERGPEIFVPKSAGTIIPNHAMGGNTVTVRQSFHMSPGLQGTVEAEVRRAAPGIAAAAKAAVFQSIEKGGRESQLVNRRN